MHNQIAKTKLLYSANHIWVCGAVSAGYLLLSAFLIGFKIEQVYLVALFSAMYFASGITRKFITGFSIFIIFWVLYDYMKAFPNYLYQTVHIEDLYLTEKKLFGINYAGTVVTLNEYFLQHHSALLDIITGVSYLCWVPVPLAFAGFLFFKDRSAFLQFSLSFFLVNLIGFVIYYIYPAAPPWYVQQHGFAFIASTHGNTAGLERFDTYFNSHIFRSLYTKGSNVFAAMPSLHASYPVIVLYYGNKFKLGKINILFALLVAGIWFSAIYNSHHYVLDILAGITCAITGIALFQWAMKKNKAFQSFLRMFVRAIE